MSLVTDLELVLGPEEKSLTRTINHLDKSLFRRISNNLSDVNVSQTQALFIIYLGSHTDGPVYQYMLERAFGITNPTATASIRSLIKKNIVTREKDPDDGRYYRLSLTDYGSSLFLPCLAAFRATETELEKRLTPEERNQFIALLTKLL